MSRLKSIVSLSNKLDPDQDRSYVGPDLGPKCYKMLYHNGHHGCYLAVTLLENIFFKNHSAN